MPSLNWGRFAELSGDLSSNFEELCQVLIRRHYGRYGEMRALAQQPGVEFHLKLLRECPALGGAGRWFGWQCRWYDLQSGRAIGDTRRKKIQAAIDKTAQALPGLTDWILWTKNSLTKRDQEWFYGLDTQMQLHLWTASQVDEHLSGSAEIFRSTYFGDLVLTPENLSDLHDEATARIRARWQPDLHQTIDAERAIRRKLGQVDAWSDLCKLPKSLGKGCLTLDLAIDGIPVSYQANTAEAVRIAQSSKATLERLHSALSEGNLDSLHELLHEAPSQPPRRTRELPRKLRSKQHHAALDATNILADIQSTRRVFKTVGIDLGTRQVALIAEYGCGKTHLAAQLTSRKADRPAGILLHGRDLNAGGNLNQLAGTVVIQGAQTSTMEALVAAVDGAGRRAHRRIPIVIDGLNESEDPRDWKGLLASLDETLRQYPYVLFVTTVRPEFVDEVLPEAVDKLEIPDFGDDTTDAISLYFEHYRIDATDPSFHWDMLTHPLTLRMFCEVTNPKRETVVEVEVMPTSLTGLFDRYLQESARRIAELSSHDNRYAPIEVYSAFYEIGMALWEERSRDLSMSVLRKRLGDDKRQWNQSLARALEQDGVLLRVRGGTPNEARVSAAYDALGGHLVADAILAKQGRHEFETWLKEPETLAALTGSWPEQHPLAADARRALAGLTPRRFHGQHFWTFLEEPLRTAALRDAADLEGAYLDVQTVDELATLIARGPNESHRLFDRSLHTRSSTSHPLNSKFLERSLRPLQVAERDIRWTEWVRRNARMILADLRECEGKWRDTMQRDPSDLLRAQWIKWILTSTHRGLRDHASKTLYWYGRGAPSDLFGITVDALSINDPYVFERLLAVSYGVAMANQVPCADFARSLGSYLQGIANALVGASATHPTNHHLARRYVADTVAFALHFCPSEVPEALQRLKLGFAATFAPEPSVRTTEEDDASFWEVELTFIMEPEMQFLDGLLGDPGKSDLYPHLRKAVASHVVGTIRDLGWREDLLGEIDKTLIPTGSSWQTAEHYRKKYAWIGLCTFAGSLDGEREHIGREDLRDHNVDLSFPEQLVEAPLQLPSWANSAPEDDRSWIRKGRIEVPDQFLNPGEIGTEWGPWVITYGYLVDRDQVLGRRVSGCATALLVESNRADELVKTLKHWENSRVPDLPMVPNDYLTFAGEVPWSPHFARDQIEGSSYSWHVSVGKEPKIKVEMLAHIYNWESYRRIGISEAPIPSKSFSTAFDLRGTPQTFDQGLPDGTLASKTLGASRGFSGHLLYLREDLVREYAKGRQLVWLTCGDRLLIRFRYRFPDWLENIFGSRAHLWHHVRRLDGH